MSKRYINKSIIEAYRRRTIKKRFDFIAPIEAKIENKIEWHVYIQIERAVYIQHSRYIDKILSFEYLLSDP